MAKLNIEVPDKVYKSLLLIAQQTEHSKEYIINQALENYLQQLQEDIEDYQAALEAEADPSPTISFEEVKKEYGLED